MLKYSIALALMLTAGAMPQAQRASDAALVNHGSDVFVTYCASCHGTSGRGDGPAAQELRRLPADLTQVAKRNGNLFDEARIHTIIDGRTVKAHGTMEMPVWGDAFRFREGLTEAAIKTRIDALVRYLESIQERATH